MAAIGLGRIGGAGKELLAALDREQDERVREAIAYGLLLMRNKELRDGWRARADDTAENPQVRALAPTPSWPAARWRRSEWRETRRTRIA
ncbi:MAG: hypothetical protein ACYTEG_17885, partial [Planctomycetota bacterium]|jgi:hypothetical protein